MRTEQQLLDWAECVTTKFGYDVTGWTYTNDMGDLKHIRFTSDSTGYNSFRKRLRRAFRWNELWGLDGISKLGRIARRQRGTSGGPLKRAWLSLLGAWNWITVSLKKDDNLPDCLVNGNPIFWSEDGEYMTLFGPNVGVRVLDFVRANPENEYAQAIVAEMMAAAERSWPSDKEG